MRLGEELLERIHGHAGRVTCKRCGNKVAIDAHGVELVVKDGGKLIDEPASVGSAQDPPVSSGVISVAQHWSEFPQGGTPSQALPEVRVSMAPPLPEDLKRRRAVSRLASAEQGGMDAPAPELAAPEGDSLSPHSLTEVSGDDEPLRLPANFKSSPMASNVRDETFKSLYPEPQRLYPTSTGESRFSRQNRENVPHPPVAGELQRPEPLLVVAPSAAAETKSNWAPWGLAAAACVGLIVNLALGTKRAPVSATAAPARAEISATVPAPAVSSNPLVVAASASVNNWVEDTPITSPSAASGAAPAPSIANGSTVAAPAQSPPSPRQPKSKGSQSELPVAPPEEPQLPFSPSAAADALSRAAAMASRCRRPDDPSGEVRLTVTFAPSGRVTTAQVAGPPFAGTATGSCIAEQFRSARVPEFSGQRVTMHRTVTIR